MRIEWIDKDKVKIRVENEKDLFTLYKIINPSDILSGYDYRTIEFEKGKEKKKVWIKIEVERVKFSEYGDSLRINGKILEASEIVVGKYHTFDIRIGSEIILEKKFTKFDIEELEKATKKRKEIYVLSLDNRNIALAKISDRIEIIIEEEVNIPKEDLNRDSIYKQKLSNVIKKIEEKPEILVIVGPVFYPDYFEEYIREKLGEDIKILKFRVSQGGINGVIEFSKRKEYLDTLKEYEILELNKIIDDFIKSMLNGMVVMGLEKVKEYAEIGNIDYLLISEDFYKKMKEDGKINIILNIIDMVEKTKGKIYFIYKNIENYELINKFGIVAKIKYKI